MKSLSVALTATLVLSAGCRGGEKEYQPYSASNKTYLPVVRVTAPEPVYSRTRWVLLPDVLPEREMPGTDGRMANVGGPALRPVYHLELKNSSLEETARVLAALSRYSSYTAPSIATKKFTIENLGTIDELGEIIAHKAEIQVVVDHEHKEVRFLAPSNEEPQLFSE
jgi:hypothetical protein